GCVLLHCRELSVEPHPKPIRELLHGFSWFEDFIDEAARADGDVRADARLYRTRPITRCWSSHRSRPQDCDSCVSLHLEAETMPGYKDAANPGDWFWFRFERASVPGR